MERGEIMATTLATAVKLYDEALASGDRRSIGDTEALLIIAARAHVKNEKVEMLCAGWTALGLTYTLSLAGGIDMAIVSIFRNETSVPPGKKRSVTRAVSVLHHHAMPADSWRALARVLQEQGCVVTERVRGRLE
jgi:hypothetical protein